MQHCSHKRPAASKRGEGTIGGLLVVSGLPQPIDEHLVWTNPSIATFSYKPTTKAAETSPIIGMLVSALKIKTKTDVQPPLILIK